MTGDAIRSPSAPRTCARCGAILADGAAECPRCLLRLGLRAAPPAHAHERAPSDAPLPAGTPPALEEVRAAFPDLVIESLLGRGGMGAVFRARQPKLDRTVALKVLPRALGAEPAFADRFLREARALARLTHTGIVTVHDFGQSNGLFFLLMEHVDGVDLRRLLQQGPLAPRQALAIARDLCDALQYAHDEGVVHRDIKPENVLVDAKGRVKVADFGLAKLVGPAADAFVTRSDQVMGTPHYMAPEQLERPRDVDHRADIFALGVVLYEMLTGSLPRGNFEPPSRRVEVDVRLDEIVLKALEREPERRYQHALEVRTDVDHVAADAKTGAARVARTSAGATPERAAGAPRSDVARTAPPPLRADPLREPRAFVLFLATWTALAVLWNLGPFAFGAGFTLVAVVLGAVASGRMRADAELAAAIESESRHWRAARLLGVGFTLILALCAIGAALYHHWSAGTPSWSPAYLGPMGAFETWKSDVFALIRLGGALPVELDPQLALTKSYTSGVRDLTDPDWSLVLVTAGVCLFLLAACQAIHVRQPRELRCRASRAGLWISTSAILALVVLSLGVELAPLAKERTLASVDRHVSTDVDLAGTADRLYAALLAEDLRVDVDQRLAVRDRRSGEEGLAARLYRAQRGSPFDRFATGWDGARRATPQIWATLVPHTHEPGTAVLLRAGLYEDGSPEREAAEELLARLDWALRAGE